MRFAALALLGLVAPVAAQAADPRAVVEGLQKIVTPNGIDRREAIEIGGIKQWITVRGRDKDNPILLFLHGGPAAPEMPTSWTFQSPWEDYFTVVQWDQRGAGKTYLANDPERVRLTLSAETMEKDTQELVQYLRATYHKDKIFVLGHSWGTILGLKLAQAHPEWLYAYIGMGQIVDSRESERLGYLATLKAAEDAHNEQAIKELKSIAPYPQADGGVPLAKIDIERKWSVIFGGLSWRRDSYAYYYRAGALSPDYGDAELDAIDKGSALSLPILLKGMATADFTHVTDFKCPIVLFNGRHDDTTSAKVAADWFAHVKAPSKKLVWFENSAHMMQIEEPGRMLVHLVEDVRPLAD